ncbi:MAG: hypothetical protein K2J23_07735, partial [Muribaculaceae bacterium]|nr:hypothetical protein [Muribaculaceae bacterium]
LLGFIGIFFPLLSCSSDSDSENNDSPRAIRLTAEQQQLSEKLHSYSIKLLSDIEKVNQEDTDLSGNAICSPLGVQMVLSIIANGVDENDRKEVLSYLGTDNLELLNGLNRELLAQLPFVDKKASLAIGNALWINSAYDYRLNKSFTQTVVNNYNSLISEDDFVKNNEATLNNINKWVDDSSNGLIQSHFSELDSSALAIILNSLYFRCKWAGEYFSDKDTSLSPFYGISKTSEVETMKSKFFTAEYYKEDSFELAEIPMGNHGYSFIIVLPQQEYHPIDLLNTWSSSKWTDILKKKDKVTMQLMIPKLSLSTSIDFEKVFMNSNPALLGNKTFTLFDNPVDGFIQLLQSNAFTLDEKGTEAASVSSGTIMDVAPGFERVEMEVNRPFLFFIIENSTDSILLEGVINDL